MSSVRPVFVLILAMLPTILHAQQVSYVQLKTADGVLEGVVSADGKVRTFKGIPYAAPPIGVLRWKEPQPVAPWSGVRKAAEYGARAMQGRIYEDMVFHDTGPSEDCLYLNMWMPADTNQEKLPVMVWIHGGGFVAGSSSEPRQDAGNLSKKGVLVVSMNYRLGVFGFLAHPDLTRESGRDASGNYGLLDQVAALKWVKRNIATFGGDPDNVTIFGESSGSASVSALVASPLAEGLFNRAIGESGAFFSRKQPSMRTRAEAEEDGVRFAQSVTGGTSIETLRSAPAADVLAAALKMPRDAFRPIVDGYFLPADCMTIYSGGTQNHVALLAGWNRDEGYYRDFFGNEEPTAVNYARIAATRFGSRTQAFLRLYPVETDAQARRVAQDYMTDQFTGYSTWKWLETHQATGGAREFRYEFDHTLPLAPDAKPGSVPEARHASEIEFVFLVLTSKHLPWRAEDRDVSELMASYWTNFAKTGDPNAPGLPRWPAYGPSGGYQVMHIQVAPRAAPDDQRGRYEFIDQGLAGR